MGEESNEPSWLSAGNDHIHQQKRDSEPLLFGSGTIPLEGEVSDDPPFGVDVESQSNYGSIKDTEDKFSVASSGKTPTSSKQGSKKQSKKKKKGTSASRPPPPQSIFNEDSSNNMDDHSSVTDDSKTALLETKPRIPQRNFCLEFFRIYAAVTIIACLGLLATQIIPLVLGGFWSQGYFDLALKVYVALFCILFIIVECNAPIPFVRNSQLLQTYISRGFVYSFLGLICLEEAYSERVKEIVSTHADEFHVAWASLFMQISSWLIFGCGLGYMLMGICCLKRLRDKIREKDKKVWKRYRRELKEWKRLNT